MDLQKFVENVIYIRLKILIFHFRFLIIDHPCLKGKQVEIGKCAIETFKSIL